MSFEFSIRSVRELKGAPLSIVVALSVVRMRVTQSWLIGATNYTDKTISTALQYLEEVGIVQRFSDGWQLADAQQLALPLAMDLPLEEERRTGEIIEGEEIEGCVYTGGVCTEAESEKFSDSGAAVALKTELKPKANLKGNSNSPPIRKNSDSGRKTVFEALKKAGVMGKTRQELGELGHVTVEMVEGWQAEIARRENVSNPVGLLVGILRSGEHPPVRLTDEQRRRSYACWDTSGDDDED